MAGDRLFRTRRLGPVLFCALVLASLSACNQGEGATNKPSEPASVHRAGDGAELVTFTQEGADRVDLHTASARQKGGRTTVPYAALIYDNDGKPWVYTAPKPLTFTRVPVVVARIDGDTVTLKSGLVPGLRVVTVGAEEVYGTERGIAGAGEE